MNLLETEAELLIVSMLMMNTSESNGTSSSQVNGQSEYGLTTNQVFGGHVSHLGLFVNSRCLGKDCVYAQ